MRSKTLGFLYFIKYLELGCLTTLTSFILIDGLTLIFNLPEFHTVIQEQKALSGISEAEADESDSYMQHQILIGISCLIVLYTLLHNNLLTNIRFYTKMRCVTFGLCTYDVCNYAICHCFLHKICRDRIPSIATFVKYGVSLLLMGYTAFIVWGAVEDIDSQIFEYEQANSVSQLHIYLVIWVLHHLIFLAARPILFILLSILCCFCENGDNVDMDNELKDRILSFDFIEYELGELNNFENHAVGIQELQFNRNLEFVRQQTLRIRRQTEEEKEMSGSRMQRLGDNLRKTMVMKMSVSRRGAECPICYLDFEDKDKIIQLTCHETHQLHIDCYDNFVKFNEEQRHALSCPMCRTKIDKANVKKKELQVAKEDDDPFALNPNAINPKHAGKDDEVEMSGLPSPEQSNPGLVNPPAGVPLAPAGTEAPAPELQRQGTIEIDD